MRSLQQLRVGLFQVTPALMSAVPVCPLHTFINDSKCHLPPNVPVPDTPATVRALTCPHTHTHTHVSTHTLAPAPPRRRTPTRRTRHGIGEVGGAGNRGRGAPRPQSKLLAEAGVPQNAEASAAPISPGSFRALHRNGVTRAPEFK